MICNKDLVTNLELCNTDEILTLTTNGGAKSFTQMGVLKLLPLAVHYNGDSIANILSLKDVADLEGCSITMDTTKSYILFSRML